jgi:Na+/H+-dicarboxylate symporter
MALAHSVTTKDQPPQTGPLGWYNRTPLYVRIIIALVIGAIVGKLMGERAAKFKPFSDIVLQLLKLLATPLIFVAVVHALLKAQATGKTAARLAWLLITNTTVAILVGLLVANTLRPGRWSPFTAGGEAPAQKPFDAASEFLSKVPGNFVDPFRTNEILSIIIVAISFGIAMRIVRARQQAAGKTGYKIIEDLMETIFELVMVTLQWIFQLVPLAVFGVVARTVGTQGFKPLISMGMFVLAVIVALALQAAFYLARMRLGSWVRPGRFLKGASDALALAFSTASSAATLPVTYSCAIDKIGIREESAGMGIMVGGTFNHDGTALYEAMAALFVGQALGMHLGLGHQIIVVFMSIIASVGAAGIPEAGLVTMLAVFSAVHLPAEYVPLLLPLDWFLDRCRTCINVMGDMSVACLLDGKHPKDSDVGGSKPDEPGIERAGKSATGEISLSPERITP